MWHFVFQTTSDSSGARRGKVLPLKIHQLIQSSDIESLKHENSKIDANMGQMYSVLETLSRRQEDLGKVENTSKVAKERNLLVA